MRLNSGMTRVALWLAVGVAPTLALGACGGGGSGHATLSCPTCKPGTTSSAPVAPSPAKPASAPAKPASAASTAAKAPWPAPPTPQPVQGVLTGRALRDYVLNSARYMIDHPQLLDQTPTIAGITNAHGIRVDIYNWIQGLPMTPAQKEAMVQYAHATQDELLVNSTSTQAIGLVDKEASDAINCFLSQFSGTFSGHSWVDAIDFMTANTPLRQKSYMAYNNAPLVDGSDSLGNTCKAY